MFNQVIEGCKIMIHIGFQDKVLISGILLPPFLCHFIQRGLKQIDLPSNKINCFWYSFYLPWREKAAMLVKCLPICQHFHVIGIKLNVCSFFFFIPEGFLITCNTLLTDDKINFILAISGRCNQHAICLSAQNYHFC